MNRTSPQPLPILNAVQAEFDLGNAPEPSLSMGPQRVESYGDVRRLFYATFTRYDTRKNKTGAAVR